MADIQKLIEELEQQGSVTEEQAKELFTALGESDDIPEGLLDRAMVIPGVKEGAEKFQQQSKLSGALEKGVQTALNLFDIGTSVDQISTARRAQRGLERPGIPGAMPPNRELQHALEQSRMGQYDAARAVAPAQAEIERGYQEDLQRARTRSGGQSGAEQTMGQVASMRRNQAAQQLTPLYDSVRQREQQRHDGLLNTQLQEQAMRQRQMSDAARQSMDLYQQEQRFAGGLEAMGRQNLRTSLHNYAPNFTDTVSRVAPDLGQYAQFIRDRLRRRVEVGGHPLQSQQTVGTQMPASHYQGTLT